MSDGSEKRPLTKLRWYVSIKTRTFASEIHVMDHFKVV